MPFMCLKCWELDTLFLVFEEDYRFEPEDEDTEPQFVKASGLQEVVGVPGVEGVGPSTPMSSSLAGATRAPHLFLIWFYICNMMVFTIMHFVIGSHY